MTIVSCNGSNDEPIPPETLCGEWSETISGADEVIGAYPDIYSNYWEYTWSIKDNPDAIICLKGMYPHCRYFSFSLYDDLTGSAIGGIDDVNITPDDGSVNPFLHTTASPATFTVYIVPAGVSEATVAELDSKNVCRINAGVEKAVVMMRHYLGTDASGNPDEYGGVEMPRITALSGRDLKSVDAPGHLLSNVYNATSQAYVQKSDEYEEMPFFLAPVSKYYPNNSTAYLYARTHIHTDEVLTFSFIPAVVPTMPEENPEAPARYWSMCLGSAADTRSYLSLCDRNANWKPGEKAEFVVVLASNPRLDEIRDKVAAQTKAGERVNLFVWDSSKKNVDGKPIGETIAFMYRNILPDKSWPHSIANMIPTDYMDDKGEPIDHVTDPSRQIADIALGDYGPRGRKVSTSVYLAR
ncbi:MAG: hypothetical protein ACI30N_03805 [Muribaculaceae bacterium]